MLPIPPMPPDNEAGHATSPSTLQAESDDPRVGGVMAVRLAAHDAETATVPPAVSAHPTRAERVPAERGEAAALKAGETCQHDVAADCAPRQGDEAEAPEAEPCGLTSARSTSPLRLSRSSALPAPLLDPSWPLKTVPRVLSSAALQESPTAADAASGNEQVHSLWPSSLRAAPQAGEAACTPAGSGTGVVTPPNDRLEGERPSIHSDSVETFMTDCSCARSLSAGEPEEAATSSTASSSRTDFIIEGDEPPVPGGSTSGIAVGDASTDRSGETGCGSCRAARCLEWIEEYFPKPTYVDAADEDADEEGSRGFGSDAMRLEPLCSLSSGDTSSAAILASNPASEDAGDSSGSARTSDANPRRPHEIGGGRRAGCSEKKGVCGRAFWKFIGATFSVMAWLRFLCVLLVSIAAVIALYIFLRFLVPGFIWLYLRTYIFWPTVTLQAFSVLAFRLEDSVRTRGDIMLAAGAVVLPISIVVGLLVVVEKLHYLDQYLWTAISVFVTCQTSIHFFVSRHLYRRRYAHALQTGDGGFPLAKNEPHWIQCLVAGCQLKASRWTTFICTACILSTSLILIGNAAFLLIGSYRSMVQNLLECATFIVACISLVVMMITVRIEELAHVLVHGYYGVLLFPMLYFLADFSNIVCLRLAGLFNQIFAGTELDYGTEVRVMTFFAITLFIGIWTSVAARMTDRFAAIFRMKYPVYRGLRLIVAIVESSVGLYLFLAFFRFNYPRCGTVPVEKDEEDECLTINQDYVRDTYMILSAAYLARMLKWVGNQTGVLPLLLRKCVRTLKTLPASAKRGLGCLRRNRDPGPERQQSWVEARSNNDASENRGLENESEAGLPRDQSHARCLTRAALVGDPDHRSCRAHRVLVDLISWEHRMEGVILAELCFTCIITFFRFTDGSYGNLLRGQYVFYQKAAMIPGLSLAFTLAYIPLFFVIRRINLARIGVNSQYFVIQKTADWLNRWSSDTAPAATASEESACTALQKDNLTTDPRRVAHLLSRVERKPWGFLYIVLLIWQCFPLLLFLKGEGG